MANIYCTALYDLGQDYPLYERMYGMSCESVHNFMHDFDKHIVLKGKEDNPFEMLRQTYYGIMAEVKKGNSVFFMEIDAIMVKPVFGMFEFDKVEMFARTSPWSLKYKGVIYDPYMNSGIKYFPATLPRELIAKADEMILNYDESFWGYDQVVYNMLYYFQHERATLRTHLNYMPFKDFVLDIRERDASIIHLCSSRGAKECHDRMYYYYMNGV